MSLVKVTPEAFKDPHFLPSIKGFRHCAKYVEAGDLYCMTLEYDPEKVSDIGLFDMLGFDDPRSIACVNTFRQVNQVKTIELYLRLGGQNYFNHYFDSLRRKFATEVGRGAFQEYVSKRSRKSVYVISPFALLLLLIFLSC